MGHDRSGHRAARARVAPGFTILELLIGVSIISVLLLVVGPPFHASRGRSAVAHSADEFQSTIRRAHSEAVRGTGLTRLHTDASQGRFWIESDTSWGGGAPPIQIGGVRDVSIRGVSMSASRDYVCFNARGLPTQAYGCPPSDLTVVFNAGYRADTVRISPAGWVDRR